MKFAILSEQNGKEMETWYHFVQYEGNESVLQDLARQLEGVDMSIEGDNSVFVLDVTNLVSETTVDEFLKIDTVNSYMIGIKIVGLLKPIDLEIDRAKDMESISWDIDSKLCYGQIEKYVIS